MLKMVLGSYSARGKEKPQEHQEIDAQVAVDHAPNHTPPHRIGRRLRSQLCFLPPALLLAVALLRLPLSPAFGAGGAGVLPSTGSAMIPLINLSIRNYESRKLVMP